LNSFWEKSLWLDRTLRCLDKVGMDSQRWFLSMREAFLGKADKSICLLEALFLGGLTLFPPV
jgi:hypothetical protein